MKRRFFFQRIGAMFAGIAGLVSVGHAQQAPAPHGQDADTDEGLGRLNRAVLDAADAWSGPFVVGTSQERTNATIALLDAINARKKRLDQLKAGR